ncbi:glycosyltransferase family 2 protein [Salinicola endophyticus]|uniref:Glycosyltransferase family 2 protein n=1 Tax=Salinicola endophyticus TaxID=1949083 RepID=A0ABY8FFY6_9GAMM|nr:glycosyltransferase family A protein [Salinicola endophyticus]WFF41701.1 glycosyltransferase family 2 protein [Salinicola endophyticus]
MTRPRFSVVIPVYNAADSIEETVASVLRQTEPHFELWLIDDGSTDDSLARLHALEARDARIRVVSMANGGVAAARNAGADRAEGEWIAFLDADDVWHPTKLERHWQHHGQDPLLDMSFSKIAFLLGEGDDLARAQTISTVPPDALTLGDVLGENPVCTSSNLVVSRECWQASGGFRRGMQYAEDQEWLARAVNQGRRIRGMDVLLVGYRLSADGLSANLRAMYDGWQTLTQDYAADFDASSARALYCRYLARRALRAGSSPWLAPRFALVGVASSPRAFFRDRRRGLMTLAGAMVSPLLPRTLRMRLFA